MPSTYSTNLGFELPANGEQVGTWGDTVNRNIGILVEQAISGMTSVVMVDANVTLTSTAGVSNEARAAILSVGGVNTAVRDVIIPAVTKVYIVYNSTSGGKDIRVKTATGVPVSVSSGATALVYCDGVNTNLVANNNVTSSGTVTSITAGTGLSGGTITGAGTISLAAMLSLVPGTYGAATAIPVFTVDGYGRITYASQVSIGGGTGSGTVTQVNSGVGLTGGPITSSGTLSLTTTGVSPRTYGSSTKIPIVTVDAYGRVTGMTEATLTSGQSISNTGGSVTTTTTGILMTSSGAISISNGGTFALTGSQTIGGSLSVTGGTTINGSLTLTSSAMNLPSTFRMGAGATVLKVGADSTSNQLLVSTSGTVIRGVLWDSSASSLIVGRGIPGGSTNTLIFSGDSTTGSATFSVATVYKTGGGSFSATSDERLKDVHGVYTKGLGALKELELVEFNYKNSPNDKYTGLIAQKVRKTQLASMVGCREDGYLTVDNSELIYTVINAVRELDKRLTSLGA